MDFLMDIAIDSDAFCPSNGAEVARLLRALADRIEYSHLYAGYACALYDANGIYVGNAMVSDAQEEQE